MVVSWQQMLSHKKRKKHTTNLEIMYSRFDLRYLEIKKRMGGYMISVVYIKLSIGFF